MLLTQTNRLKLNQRESEVAKQLCRLSKNMFNVGLYNVRQYFFQERKHLRYSNPNSIVEDDGGPQPLSQNGRGDGGEVQLI